MSVIVAEGLTKRYGHQEAVRGIDLRVEPGEVYGVIGPNGAGKTTTIRMLLDVIRPTSGRLEVLGQAPRESGPELRRRIGYLPGELLLDGRADVMGLLRYFGSLSGGVPDTRIVELAGRLGLDLSRRVGSLSKGNKQKVGLVQAFAHRPELLVLDEPTSGLDPLLQQEFLAMLREARAEGQTVFLSSHVLSEIQQAADRVAILREGRLVTVSETDTLRRTAGHRIRIRFADHVDAHAFDAVEGVRRAWAEDGEVVLDVHGTPDAVVKAAARHTVLDLVAEEPDLESAVLRLYAPEEVAS
jgi:ABC-2 type transport system ATP-binding protein